MSAAGALTAIIGDLDYEYCAEPNEGISLGDGEAWWGTLVRYRRLGARRWVRFNLIGAHSWDDKAIVAAITWRECPPAVSRSAHTAEKP